MFNISSFLNNIDGAAKDVLEDSPRESATSIRSSRRKASENDSENDFASLIEEDNEIDDNDNEDEEELNDFENNIIEENSQQQDIKVNIHIILCIFISFNIIYHFFLLYFRIIK
jgi:hypothetical protein